MNERLAGKVAFITGAARGQGRAHALRMAEEGADIVAVDICAQIPSNKYPLATEADLADTADEVRARGRTIVAVKADVRERGELRSAVDKGLAELNAAGLDIVVANAGIFPMAFGDPDPGDFIDAVDVDLGGVMNAVAVALPTLRDGASIIVTGSTAAMMPNQASNPVLGPGGGGYTFAKSSIVAYVEQLALHLAPRFIRVNAIHPTNVRTHLLLNEGIYAVHRPDLDNPTLEDAIPAFTNFQAMPIPYIEPEDVANLAVFLASDEARYITGQQIRIDAGSLLKFPAGAA
ncbi:mycofactocin-coupled SDR family oxidoreductase [Trebonia sp.]|uniref:mycofactocin-coupled SDR family oxidoreductase n=1 Tax=Trebonia sp. TaxID=2767075 RepID=UPI00261689D8|nr:mycofactocin-coupled SDR family oxidoreductase [Trebonia sp.]